MEKDLLGKKRNENSKNNLTYNKINYNETKYNNNKIQSHIKNENQENKTNNYSYKKNENLITQKSTNSKDDRIININSINNQNKQKTNSFNSYDSDDSDIINELLEKKLAKKSLIKNFNNNNHKHSSNKFNNKFDHKENNKKSFGIKFSKKRVDNQEEDSYSENASDEEILSNEINSESEQNYKNQENLLSDESSEKPSNNDFNSTKQFSKSKRFEFSYNDDNTSKIKSKNENRKKIVKSFIKLNESDEESEVNNIANKKLFDTTRSKKLEKIISEEESQAADFIGFKNSYSTTVNTNKNQFKDEKSINDSSKEKEKDITTEDFIPFPKKPKDQIEEDIDKNTFEENNFETLNKEFLGESLMKPLFMQYPWITSRTAQYKGMIKLHYEICDFYDYVKPHKREHEIRKKSFEILKNLIILKFPNWRVKVFGSFPNEIFLSDSDVDIVVISNEKKECAKKTMDKLYDFLYMNSEKFDYIKRIDAKVPIVKLQLKETKINLDISVDRKNGYDAKRIIKKSLNDFHALKPLMYLLKYFMRQKKLNETFSGGVSSFLLFNLVLAFLQYKNKTETSINLNLGQLLVDFFQFYGFEFNYDEVGISVRYGGFFYKRKDKDGRPSLLSVENFQDINQNIGSGAYKFRKVLDCFKQARDALYYPSSYPIHSYLGQFITTDAFLRNRYKFQEED